MMHAIFLNITKAITTKHTASMHNDFVAKCRTRIHRDVWMNDASGSNHTALAHIYAGTNDRA